MKPINFSQARAGNAAAAGSDFTTKLAASIRRALPKPTGDDQNARIDHWLETDRAIGAMYGQLNRFLAQIAGGPSSKAAVCYSAPDILRAELFQTTSDRLRDVVDRAIAAECSRLATAVSSQVLPELARTGRIGTLQRFGAQAFRGRWRRNDGASFEFDVIATKEIRHRGRLHRFDRRLVRRLPPWLESRTLLGRCVRMVDDKNVPRTPSATPLALLTCGTYVLTTSRPLVPKSSRQQHVPLSQVLVRLPNSRSAAIGAGCALPLLSLGYGIAVDEALCTVLGGVGLLGTILFLLRGGATHATTP